MRPLPSRAYHLTLTSNLPSIEQYGLLSTRALRVRPDLGIPAAAERALARPGHRAARVALSDGVTLNDQAPMPPTALARCLVDMTPDDWYALVDGKVFFWLDGERLARLRHAARTTGQTILVVDVASLLARHGGGAA